MEDDPSGDTYSATNHTNERKEVGVEVASKITEALQDKVGCYIYFHASNKGSDQNWVDESLIASLVSPKAYKYNQVYERLDEQERIAKSKETVLMRDVDTLDTSKPSAEEEAKNIQVQEVQKWITGAVQQTIFGYINFNVLEMEVRKNIAARVKGWNWEIDHVEKCPVMNKKNVVVGTHASVRGMECIATLQ
jgi:hypothetical protein